MRAIFPVVLRDRKGAAAIEFAMVAPLFLLAIFGIMHLAMLGFTAANIHYAVEAGARCASINTSTCSSDNLTKTYTLSKFQKISSAAPVFSASTDTCGHKVSGTINYKVDAVFQRFTVPLRATACFP